MNMITQLTYSCDIQSLHLLQKGETSAFNSIYKSLYPVVIRHVLRRVKNDLFAGIITQDAFLMVWLLRQKIDGPTKLNDFLKKQIQQGCANFYSRALRFYNTLVKLDDIVGYQEFMCGYDPEKESETIIISDFEPIDAHKMQQWKEVINVIPCLSEKQQLFIKLCLKHSFNYDEIATRLGGISAYQVGKQVEATLTEVKNIVMHAKKLNHVKNRTAILFEGKLTDEQVKIMHLRYEMNLCFEEISKKLKLPQAYVQRSFITACSRAKEIKRNTRRSYIKQN